MLRQALIAALICVAWSAQRDKIESALLAKLKDGSTRVNVVVDFAEKTQPILNKVNSMRFESRGAKITFMKTQLEELAAESQKNVVNTLKSRGFTFSSFWINNRVIARKLALNEVQEIAALPEVTGIREEIIIRLDDPVSGADNEVNAEWGIEKIEAEAAWTLPGGNNGAGAVVSSIDTGVRYTHEALRSNYRSTYGWFDPYYRTPRPVDENGHGTHTMGTIAGSHGVGVAPGAQWIACRGCDTSSCSEDALTSCGQWVACPTTWNGQQPNCDMAPRVCSNSWGGGRNDQWYRSIVEGWHTAGIIPVFSQGNSGSSCGTANSPGDMDNVIGVGSTDISDYISYYSSRGPAGDNRLKPDVSAPGSSVISSYYRSDTDYYSMSGTSMAAPHVAGTVALMLANKSKLTYDQVKELLELYSDRETLNSTQTCGDIPPTVFPNHVFGHGRINARRSLAAAIELQW